ncbi:4'-phosphopantetheinyl transferase superfamily protein, partial [uncultured Ruminococcus sp.]
MIYQGIVNVSAINDFDNVNYLTDCVSAERKNRISKFLRDEDKIRSLAAELLLRHMLSTIYGINVAEIMFGADKYGKPYLIGSEL